MRTLTADIAAQEGKSVTVAGWVHRIRDLGSVCFVLLRDRTGVAQLVFDEAPQFGHESVIEVTGVVRGQLKAPGGYEVQAEACTLVSEAARDLPLLPNRLPPDITLSALLDNRMLSLRAPAIQAVFRIQASIIKHFADYLRAGGFTEIKSSKLIASGTEGGSGLFKVEYFDTEVYLAQSPQLYKQAMVASGMERVFEIGNAYRAEKHDTARHLNEYVSLDVEMGFIDNIDTLIDLEIGILSAIFAGLRGDCADEIAEFGFSVPDGDLFSRAPRIDYSEALQVLGEKSGASGGGRARRPFEITPEGERVLCQWAEEKHGIDAVFVTGFPLRKRPFYTLGAEPGGDKSASFDLLFRGLEMTTGGLRIHRHGELVESIKRAGLSTEALAGYLRIFEYGAPPHGGFAIGLERLTQKICNLGSVKEASLFPRDRTRVSP